jgi:general secretion pathway protein J
MKRLSSSSSGFTLIELMIAIALLSLLALMGWKGIDGLLRTRDITQQHTQQSARLSIALAQWRADLDAIHTVSSINPSGVDWDGKVLRMVRRSSALQPDGSESGVWVVAWTLVNNDLNQGQWMRWQSEAITQNSALEQAWSQALQWGQNQSNDITRQTSLISANNWQLFYFRGNAWINPLSSQDNASTTTSSTLPDAIRLQIDVAPDNGMSGPITLDWVRPNFSNIKS